MLKAGAIGGKLASRRRESLNSVTLLERLVRYSRGPKLVSHYLCKP